MAIINGTNTANTLNGGAENDSISGLAGNDTINGGAGNDTINGGPGIDVMTGGAGADVFVFASGDGGNVEPHDRITDFQVGTDRLQLPGAIIGTQAVSNVCIRRGPPTGLARDLSLLLRAFFRAPVRTGSGVADGDHQRSRAAALLAG
jgi:Ca2+-binding RTX toxin-like protein